MAVSAGGYHNLALKSDGSLWAWGANYYGQLGLGNDGSGTERSSPEQVGTDTNWVAISAGYDFSLALKSDGTLWAWGPRLGSATLTIDNLPVQVGTDSDWAAIAAGGNGHALALKSNGAVYAWGENYLGQLGLGDTNGQNFPGTGGCSRAVIVWPLLRDGSIASR